MKDVLCSIIAFGAFVKAVKSFGSQQALRSASLKQEIGKALCFVCGGGFGKYSRRERQETPEWGGGEKKNTIGKKKRRNRNVH